MELNLAPGESLPAGATEQVRATLDRPGVEAVLLPLLPRGEGALQRAARRYLAAWDGRFVHPQTFFAPASRCATRAPLPGHRNADAAPFLADVLAGGGRVEALTSACVETPIAESLESWRAWAGDEGRAWGDLAARDARFPPFLPALSRRQWARHNLLQLPRRIGEALEAARRPDALVVALHLAREAAWTGACARAYREPHRRRPTPF